jgi:hypothetical protein
MGGRDLSSFAVGDRDYTRKRKSFNVGRMCPTDKLVRAEVLLLRAEVLLLRAERLI